MNEVFSAELLNKLDRTYVCEKCGSEKTEYHLVDPSYGDQIWVDRCGIIWIKKILINDGKVKEIC